MECRTIVKRYDRSALLFSRSSNTSSSTIVQHSTNATQVKTLQEAAVRHGIIAQVALHALAIEQHVDFPLHDRRRRVDDHEVELPERRHQ